MAIARHHNSPQQAHQVSGFVHSMSSSWLDSISSRCMYSASTAHCSGSVQHPGLCLLAQLQSERNMVHSKVQVAGLCSKSCNAPPMT